VRGSTKNTGKTRENQTVKSAKRKSDDQDGGAPTHGIVTLEKELAAMYRLYGKRDHFRSVVYKDAGHEYLPEMKEEMVGWFLRHLPVKKKRITDSPDCSFNPWDPGGTTPCLLSSCS
jgi:hypothetical protein